MTTATQLRGSQTESRRPDILQPTDPDWLGCELWPTLMQLLPAKLEDQLVLRSFYLGLGRQRGNFPAFIRKLLDWKEDGYTRTGVFEAETLTAGLVHAWIWAVREGLEGLLEREQRARASALQAATQRDTERATMFTNLAKGWRKEAIETALVPPHRKIRTAGRVVVPARKADASAAPVPDLAKLQETQTELVASAEAIGLTSRWRQRCREESVLRFCDEPIPETAGTTARQKFATQLERMGELLEEVQSEPAPAAVATAANGSPAAGMVLLAPRSAATPSTWGKPGNGRRRHHR